MRTFPSIDDQLRQIRQRTVEILPEANLVEKLRQSKAAGKPLRVKLGCDPSRPDLHLGHTVVLRKLRQFQDLGHEVILIVGDFTAMIGDPSGRSKTRPALTFEETRTNGQTYFDQATKILEPDQTQIRYNSEWLNTMTFHDVIQLASTYTVARMLERDDFENRFRAHEPISIHEFLYPLAQAQDSVALEADIELGGTDQKFNLLVGRDVQEARGQSPQVCITMPLLVGTDGVEKMSKSLDNYIGITEMAEEMYGKVLSIPDSLISPYFEWVTDVPIDELPRYQAFAESDPRNAKHDLAWRIVRMYHDAAAADAARAYFERTVIQKELPEDIADYYPTPSEGTTITLAALMCQAGLASSNSEARRLIQQQAVSIDGHKLTDIHHTIDLADRTPCVLKVGKRRFARIVWNVSA